MAVVVLVSDGVAIEHRLPDAGGLARSARRTLAGVWGFRASAEREAEKRFARLGRELAQVGAPDETLSLVTRAVDDERRHAALCSALADAYAGERVELRPVEEVPLGPRHLVFSDRVLYEVVAFCCITETLNTSLMKVAHDAARVPEARAALRTILRDEVRHAKVGWAHLAFERARGNGQFLSEFLPKMLAGAVRAELFSPAPAASENEHLLAHGELPEAVRLDIFLSSVRDVIAPGLAALGVDVGPLWDWVRKNQRKSAPDAIC